ncbi:MAG: TIGR02646 family protein [Acidobacteriota bacterium]|nr:TIGR02646 family protein [Acidobacteriota bacterium]
MTNYLNKPYGHSTVRDALDSIYHGKCAYCESIMEPASSGQVEHYRPKKNLIDDKAHPGYYWLAYEWTNLLLSCARCNGKKSNKFPISGKRIPGPGAADTDRLCKSEYLKAEQPCLLNPELDDPREYLRFNFAGELSARDDHIRGRQTIDLCDLNRDDLISARKEAKDWFQRMLEKYLEKVLSKPVEELRNSEACGKLVDDFLGPLFEFQEERTGAAEEYSAYHTYIMDNFERVMLPEFPEGDARKLVRLAYRRFRNSRP